MLSRRSRKIILKRKRRKRKLRLYSLLGLLIVFSIFAFSFIVKLPSDAAGNKPDIIITRTADEDLGNIHSIIEYGDNVLIGVHYPVFGQDNIDAISKKLVNQYISEFSNELTHSFHDDENNNYELNIDYEVYSAPDNIVSIVFDIVKDSSTWAHPDVAIITKAYALSTDQEIELQTFLDGNYLEHISQICIDYFRAHEYYQDGTETAVFMEGIYPSAENYANFVFKEDKLVFKFAKYQLFSGNYGIPAVEIPYSDLEDYIKPEFAEFFILKDDNQPENEYPKQAEFILPPRNIDPERPMIALTFDDGPSKDTTIPILDALKKHDSVATFFILGNRVTSNIDVLKLMLEQGNEIGNHSYNHKELTKLSYVELMAQITKTQDAVIEATGFEPKLIRPTYGSYDDRLKSEIDMPLILWSIDTLDWKSRSSKMVTDHVLSNVKDGDIILMHDIYDSTVAAVRILVPELINRGYQLVTISELFESRGMALEKGQIYRKLGE